jgi:peptidyl-tRNA hydrolase
MLQELIESAILDVFASEAAEAPIKGGKDKGYVQKVMRKLQEKGLQVLPKEGTVRQMKSRMEEKGMLKVVMSNAAATQIASNGPV